MINLKSLQTTQHNTGNRDKQSTKSNNRYQTEASHLSGRLENISESSHLPIIVDTSQHKTTRKNDTNTSNILEKSAMKYDKKRDVYQGCDWARSMIQTRLDKLKQERDQMTSMEGGFSPQINDLSALYRMRNLSNTRQYLANPNWYSYQFMDPIYFPLEMPSNGEPLGLPSIEMGIPPNNFTYGGGLNLNQAVLWLTAMRNKEADKIWSDQLKARRKGSKTSSKTSSSQKSKDPHGKGKKKKKDEEEKPPAPKRDWWKLVRHFVHINTYFSIASKYTKFSKIRNALISQKSKNVLDDIDTIRSWWLEIWKPFLSEFKQFEEMNVAFKSSDSKTKLNRVSEIIIPLIKLFMNNLIDNSSKYEQIPKSIRKLWYEYIKDKAYYPKKYLSTFQINRLNFNFFGSTANWTNPQVGMIVAYLIICSVTVQSILLHMKDIFTEYKNYPNIDISAKYIGSIIHYLTRDTFFAHPGMLKNIWSLMNYYRNYHLKNQQVDKQTDIFSAGILYLDEDEFAGYLIPEGQINEFWNINPGIVDNYKQFIFAWASKLGKIVKDKYAKRDKSLIPKPRMERPKDRKMGEDEQS